MKLEGILTEIEIDKINEILSIDLSREQRIIELKYFLGTKQDRLSILGIDFARLASQIVYDNGEGWITKR